MKTLPVVLPALALTMPIAASPAFQAEVGASYFALRHAQLDQSPTALTIDEPGTWAPFVAGTFGFDDRLALRLSYHYLNHVHATAVFGGPPGAPPSPLPVVIWGHYDDDVHVVSAGPEIHWNVSPAFTFAIAPQLNWVASRGTVSYSTNSIALTLVAPYRRNDDGFTVGGSARLLWSLGRRSAVSVGYQYADLDPSFDRQAQVFSGAFVWRF